MSRSASETGDDPSQSGAGTFFVEHGKDTGALLRLTVWRKKFPRS